MLNIPVSDIMSEHPIKVRADVPVRSVAHLLLRDRINGILVSDPDDEQRILGVFTTAELMKLMNEALGHGGHKMQALGEVGRLPVRDFLPPNMETLQADDNAVKAVALMHVKGVLTLPVYDGNKLVGVIGRHDVINIAFA